jgi:hypothetical protein
VEGSHSRFCVSAFIRSALFRSVFLLFSSCLPFVRFSLPASLLLFLLVQINQHQINNSNASLSRNFAGIRESIRCNGLHIDREDTDIRFVDENASDSIHRNNEPDSIETNERDLQPRKQEESRISIFAGMTMNGREEQENANDSSERTRRSAPIWAIAREDGLAS